MRRGLRRSTPRDGCWGGQLLGLLPADIDHVLLLVHGPDIVDTVAQREADLSRAARQIENPVPGAHLGPCEEIIDEALGIGHSEAVIVLGRAAVEVTPELGIIHDRHCP